MYSGGKVAELSKEHGKVEANHTPTFNGGRMTGSPFA
jgi:hypothetical protein